MLKVSRLQGPASRPLSLFVHAMPRSLLLPLLPLLLLLLPLEIPRAARASPRQASSEVAATCKVGTATRRRGQGQASTQATSRHSVNSFGELQGHQEMLSRPGTSPNLSHLGIGRVQVVLLPHLRSETHSYHLPASPEHLSTTYSIHLSQELRSRQACGGSFSAPDLLNHWSVLHPHAILVAYCVRSNRGRESWRASDTEQTHAPHAQCLAQTRTRLLPSTGTGSLLA